MRRSHAGLALLVALLGGGCDTPDGDGLTAERETSQGFPADLILDPEQPADAPVIGGVGTASRNVQVAWSGTRYLAVWEQEGVGVGGVNFTRIAADGTLLDTPSVRLPASGPPAVAFFGGFLVAARTGNVELWRVGQQGALSRLGQVGPGHWGGLPDIAAGTGEAMVVYNQVNLNGQGHIFAARYDGLAISPVVRLATGAHGAAGPHIAYRPGGDYLVVWQSAEGDVRGRFVSPAVEPGLPFPVTITAETEEVPAVAFAGSGFLVAWRALVPGGAQIRAALVSPTGEVSAPVDVSSVMAVADRPSVSCDTACTVLWTGGADPTATQLWRRRLGGDLTPLGDEAIAVGGPSVQGPGELAGTGSAQYLVWLDGQSGMVDAYGSTASIDEGGGLVLGAPTLLMLGVLHQDRPAIAASSSQWLVGWEDSRNGGVDLFGRRFDLDGVPRGASARAIHERAWIQNGVAVAGNESGFLAAWKHDEAWPSREVRASRIGPGGAALDPAGIALGPAGIFDNEIQIASAGAEGWLVAWSRDTGSAQGRVHAAIVRPDGSTTGPLEFDGDHAKVDFDPGAGVYLLLWFSRDETGTWGVRGIRIAPDGTPIDADPVTVASDIFYIRDMAFGAGRFLVVFEDAEDRVFGYRVRIGWAGIELLDPAPFPLDPAPGHQQSPAVTFTAKSFLVAYERWETGGTFDIHGVQVSPDGVVQGSAFVLADGPDVEMSPAFAGASQGRALLAFRRLSDDWPGQRNVYTVHVRRLVAGFPDGATCTDDAQCESGACIDGVCGL